MTVWLAAGAAAAILLLAIIVWAASRRAPRRIESPEEAADAAERTLGGFATEGAVVGADGAGALAVAADGRIAAVRRRGRGFAVAEIGWSALRSTGDGIVIETDDRRLGSVALVGVDALDIRRLAPHAKGLAAPADAV